MSYNDIAIGSYDLLKHIHQSLIKCLDCCFIDLKFLLFKENGFIHEILAGQTLKKIGVLIR